MTDFQQKDEARLSRRHAAERLTDIAYVLTTGGTLRLGGGQQLTVPLADGVVLKRQVTSEDGRVKLELELSW